MNLLWLIFNIPLVIVGLLVIQGGTLALGVPEEEQQSVALLFSMLYAVLLVIGPNPAAAGIHLWANRLVKEERVEFALFWEGLRSYLGKSVVLYMISTVGLLLLIVNALFYLRSEMLALRIFGIIWLYAILIWLAMQIYMLPLLVEQEDKRIRLVLRNAFFLTVTNIIPTLTLLVICGALALLSIALTLLIALMAGSVTALIAARALNILLERYRGNTDTAEA